MTLGSFITSSVYVQRTLNNKDLDTDRKKTLAINQALCFVIPTIAAYTVNNAMGDWVKKQGYRFTGLMKSNADIAKLRNQDASKYTENLNNKLNQRNTKMNTEAKVE